MADHYITTDTNIHDLAWTDNDNVIVREGATFTIDQQTTGAPEIWKIGYIRVEYGHLQIDNLTQDGLELLFNNYVFIDVKAEGTMTVNGQLIKIHTSDGTSGQTFPFWDPNYQYQITGLFVNGEKGMLMDAFSGLPTHPIKNQYIRLHKYDTSTASFVLQDFYIPPNGTDIYVPNILIKRDGTSDPNVGVDSGYVRFELANGISTKGCYHYHAWLTNGSKNVTHEDCVLAKLGYHVNIENLTFRNILTTYDSTSHYGLYVRWSTNVLMENITYYGKADFESNFNATFRDWHVFSQRNKDDKPGWRDSENLTFENFNYVYTEFVLRTTDGWSVKNFTFRFDNDYHNGYSGLLSFERLKNGRLETVRANSDFYYDRDILRLYYNSTRNIFKDIWVNVYNCNNNNVYNSLFVFGGDSHNNLVYNCGWLDSKEYNGQKNYLYLDTYNNTVMDVDLRNHRLYFMGKNNSLKNVRTRGMYYASMMGHSPLHITETDSTNTDVATYIYAMFGIDDWTIEKSDSSITSDGISLFFKNANSYAIIKPTKENGRLRKIKSITSNYISGGYTDKFTYYLSIDHGNTWVEKSSWDGLVFPDTDTDIWFKIVLNEDRPHHDASIRYIRLTVDEDTNKAAYEPYFIWTEINYKNLPEPMFGSFQVAGQPLRKFETQAATHIMYELWKENPNPVTTKIRKYGYNFYQSQATFNDASLEFFYTGYQRQDLTMTEADALAVTGVVLQASSDASYVWELDCGGNDLDSVYHYIQAKLTYHNTDLAGIDSFEFNEFLQRDGDKFKTIQARNGEGVKLINYTGKASSFTKDDGTVYVLPIYVDISTPNLISGSRVQIYNNTKGVELANTLLTTDGYSLNVLVDDTNLSIGDEIRLRATYQSGTIAKLPIQTTGVVTEAGLTFTNTQQDDELHNALGYDGSLIDIDNSPSTGEIKADFANIQIDVNDPDNIFDCRKGIAWFRYICTTEQGIRLYDPNAIAYNPDTRNILVYGSLQIENTKDVALKIVEGIWKRADGGDLIASTSNTIIWVPNDRIYESKDMPVVKQMITDNTIFLSTQIENINVSTSGLTTEEHNKLMSLQNYNDADLKTFINNLDHFT